MPIGILSTFPLHAAGKQGSPGALDSIVSSYVPTIRSLVQARERPVPKKRQQLVVAVEHSPGMPDLPWSVTEANDVAALNPDAILLPLDLSTVGGVVGALRKAPWAHFACHARIDSNTPGAGGLHLREDESTSTTVLTVRSISQTHLREAELAYLSACSTAYAPPLYSDDAINLASSFHLAGYKHVVATLWNIDDEFAPAVSCLFYGALPDGPSAEHAASTLRRVVMKMRSMHPDRPDLWASLVHSGP